MDLISEIKSRADIVQIISSHVPLKKAGKDYKARCPFHSEKTPSFTVSAEKQLFYCFGCGTGGDLIRFVMLIEKIDTGEAVRRLADRLGIERRRGDPSGSPAEPHRKVLDLAARFYEAALESPSGGAAQKYLAKRRMPPEFSRKFRIGYAPDRQDELTRRMLAKGVPEKILIETGLTATDTKDGSPHRDRFRDRLMFPILDGSGRVVGFGGRVIREGDRRPKYLNSAENELFHKGRLLYGYHTAKDMVSATAPPVLVEGYLDVIYAQSAGLAAMAAMGTALTEIQADLLARFGRPVMLAYDADLAGRKAALRSAGILLSRDVEVGVLVFPEGCDPAELVERGEQERLEQIASSPTDVFAFLVETALSMHPDSVTGRRAASQTVAEIGAALRDEIFRQKMVQAAADGFGISAAAAERMMKPGAKRTSAAPSPDEKDTPSRVSAMLLGEGRQRLEWTVLGVVLARSDLMAAAYAQIEDDFSDPEARLLWDALSAQYERRHEVDQDELLAAFADHPNMLERVTEIRVKPLIETGLSAQGFKDLLLRLRRARLKRQIDALHARLQSAEAANRREEVKQLLDEDRELKKILGSITEESKGGVK